MDDNISPEKGGKRHVGGFSANLASPKPLFWVAIIAISLVLPPLGVILAIYFVSRGSMSHDNKLYLMAVTVLASAVIGFGGLYGIRAIIHNRNLAHFSYSALDDYKLASKLKGSAISFKKPVELIQSGGSSVQLGSSRAEFFQPNYNTSPKSGIAYLSVNIVQSALATNENYTGRLDKILNNPTDNEYQTTVKPLKDFLASVTANNFKIELGPAQTLQTANIKNQAWQFDFTISNDKNITKITPLKGKLVLAVGKNSFYYFMLSTVDYNWQANQSVWQKVIDSIKINQ